MRLATWIFVLLAACSSIGCEKKKVVDIEGPGIDVEVDEDGGTDVNVGD